MDSNEQADRRLLTLRQAADRLNVSIRTTRRMVQDGRLLAFQLGGRGASIRVDGAALDRWLDQPPEDAP